MASQIDLVLKLCQIMSPVGTVRYKNVNYEKYDIYCNDMKIFSVAGSSVSIKKTAYSEILLIDYSEPYIEKDGCLVFSSQSEKSLFIRLTKGILKRL